MADTSHSLLFLSQREVIEAGVLNMEQVVPLMEKVYGLQDFGLEIKERVPLEIQPQKYDLNYMKTKQEKMDHMTNYK